MDSHCHVRTWLSLSLTEQIYKYCCFWSLSKRECILEPLVKWITTIILLHWNALPQNLACWHSCSSYFDMYHPPKHCFGTNPYPMIVISLSKAVNSTAPQKLLKNNSRNVTKVSWCWLPIPHSGGYLWDASEKLIQGKCSPATHRTWWIHCQHKNCVKV